MALILQAWIPTEPTELSTRGAFFVLDGHLIVYFYQPIGDRATIFAQLMVTFVALDNKQRLVIRF